MLHCSVWHSSESKFVRQRCRTKIAGSARVPRPRPRRAITPLSGKQILREIVPTFVDGEHCAGEMMMERNNAVAPCDCRDYQRVGRGAGLGRGLGVEVGLGLGGWVPYSSALVRTLLEPSPAATSTEPLDNNVAVCLSRASLRLPVTVQFPLAGSYNSAPAKTPVLPTPAATSALPFGNKVAV